MSTWRPISVYEKIITFRRDDIPLTIEVSLLHQCDTHPSRWGRIVVFRKCYENKIAGPHSVFLSNNRSGSLCSDEPGWAYCRSTNRYRWNSYGCDRTRTNADFSNRHTVASNSDGNPGCYAHGCYRDSEEHTNCNNSPSITRCDWS